MNMKIARYFFAVVGMGVTLYAMEEPSKSTITSEEPREFINILNFAQSNYGIALDVHTDLFCPFMKRLRTMNIVECIYAGSASPQVENSVPFFIHTLKPVESDFINNEVFLASLKKNQSSSSNDQEKKSLWEVVNSVSILSQLRVKYNCKIEYDEERETSCFIDAIPDTVSNDQLKKIKEDLPAVCAFANITYVKGTTP